MNEDILKGKWKQLRGEIQSFWGRLTNDDLDRIEGSTTKLAGKLQERYGYSRQEAEQAVADFFDGIQDKVEDRSRMS
jgi:uncharacterized protein YjbJ (UPF0337 family)